MQVLYDLKIRNVSLWFIGSNRVFTKSSFINELWGAKQMDRCFHLNGVNASNSGYFYYWLNNSDA